MLIDALWFELVDVRSPFGIFSRGLLRVATGELALCSVDHLRIRILRSRLANKELVDSATDAGTRQRPTTRTPNKVLAS